MSFAPPEHPARHQPALPKMAEIQVVVAARFGVSVRELSAPIRARRVAFPRQLAMFLARRLALRTFGEIGRAFQRDHSTAMHADRRIRARLAEDRELAAIVAQLETLLTAIRCRCPACNAEIARFPLDPPQLLLPIAWPGELQLDGHAA